MKYRVFGSAFLCLVFAAASLAADRIIPRNSKIFVDQMDNDLDGFVRAEITKEKLPVLLVLEKDAADYILIGSSADRKASWHEGWLSPKGDQSSGNVSLIDPKAKTILWSSEAGDRSLWKGNLSRGGQRKVAERLINNLKDVIKKN